VHDSCETCDVILPAAHGAQLEVPAADWNLPGGHGKHAVCATVGWYLPAGHAVQAIASTAVVNDPTEQPSHVLSCVLFGVLASRLPAAHCVCVSQNVLSAAN
jgi:hypothetical protein